MDDEIWIDIDGYDGDYQVNSYGRVKSFKCKEARIKKQRIDLAKKNDYKRLTIMLCRNGKMQVYNTSRLVAEAFIEKIEGCDCVDHIDGNPLNNNVNNLRWVNTSQNALNAKLLTRNTSGFKGVYYEKDGRNNPWKAIWYIDKKQHRKSFKTKEEALKHRQKWLKNIIIKTIT